LFFLPVKLARITEKDHGNVMDIDAERQEKILCGAPTLPKYIAGAKKITVFLTGREHVR